MTRAGSVRGGVQGRPGAMDRTGPPAGITGFVLFALVTALGGCTEFEDWCTSADVETTAILNRGPGHWERSGRSPRLVEVWRVGGLEQGQELARPTRPAVSPGGWVAIPDAVLGEVILVDPAGEWRGSILRQGQGPGEVRWPVAAGWRGDGTLQVLDLGGAKVVEFVRATDSVSGEWRIPPDVYSRIGAAGELPAVALTSRRTAVLEMPWRPIDEDPGWAEATLLEIGPDRAVDTLTSFRVRVLGQDRYRTWPAPAWARPVFAAAPSGALALGGDDARYRIRILAAGRRDSLVICRDAGPLPMARSETGDTVVPSGRAELVARLRETTRPDSAMPFGRLFFGSGGRLWVQRQRADPLRPHAPRPGARYDVFKAGGEYLGAVTAPDDVVLDGESRDLVFGYAIGELDQVSLVGYRLEQRTDLETGG